MTRIGSAVTSFLVRRWGTEWSFVVVALLALLLGLVVTVTLLPKNTVAAAGVTFASFGAALAALGFSATVIRDRDASDQRLLARRDAEETATLMREQLEELRTIRRRLDQLIERSRPSNL
jgi:hypothetical protein